MAKKDLTVVVKLDLSDLKEILKQYIFETSYNDSRRETLSKDVLAWLENYKEEG